MYVCLCLAYIRPADHWISTYMYVCMCVVGVKQDEFNG